MVSNRAGESGTKSMRVVTDMIRTLADLVSYTRWLGEQVPSLKDRTEIRVPGCPSEIVAKIAHSLPDMPETYLETISAVLIDGIEIGYFHLSPPMSYGGVLSERLSAANTPNINPHAGALLSFGLYQIASWEADPIGIAFQQGKFQRGAIIKTSIENPGTTPVKIADDYTSFLLIAGNLDEIRERHMLSGTITAAMEEFWACLPILTKSMDHVMFDAWLQIANVVLE